MGWSIDFQTHNKKASEHWHCCTGIGFSAVILKSENHNRITQFFRGEGTGIVEIIHNKRIKKVKIKREKKGQQWDIGRKKGREGRRVDGKKELILGVILKFWALCLVFYTKQFKILLTTLHIIYAFICL